MAGFVRTQAGGTVSLDLLGTDRPEDVARVYQAAQEWLNGGHI